MIPTDSSRRWRMFVDTGGTFTDCLAWDPEGVLRRAKVLSSGALRGRVEELAGEAGLRVAAAWASGVSRPLPEAFFEGCRFRLLGGGGGEREVLGWTAERRELRLDGSLPERLHPGSAFEIASPEEAPTLAARLVTATPRGEALPPMALRLATTRGTNALLERRGAPVALFITAGFADLLSIGTQQRPDLFALNIEREEPLYVRAVEVPERLRADGTVQRGLDLEALSGEAAALRAEGVESAAVALLHSYRNPVHEEALAAFLRSEGFTTVSASAALAPAIKILPRAETAVADAYLGPVIGGYLDRVAGALEEGSTLHVMTSAGGLVGASGYRAKDSLLSGPAGGVVGAARAGRAAGFERVIAFDMGGTSTDVARFDGDFEYRFEHRVGGAHLVAPALAIESVAAGGGSVCTFDGRQLKVGPRSAGADPGPACYGAGGPLTLTDVNLLLGRLAGERFEIPIDDEAARAAFEELAAAAGAGAGEAASDALLVGLVDIADELMADAIRTISVRRGYDAADYALVAFGGAGAQHACAVAALLGISTVLVPPEAALLSARGLRAAVVERFAERQVLLPLAEAAPRLEGWLADLEAEARRAVEAEGVDPAEVVVRRRLARLRFAGQEEPLGVEIAEIEDVSRLERSFGAAYRELYGYLPAGRAVEVESLRAVASSAPAALEPAGEVAPRAAVASGEKRALLGGGWRRVPAYERRELEPGSRFEGPALVLEDHTAAVVEAGWRGRVDAAGTVVLEAVQDAEPEVR